MTREDRGAEIGDYVRYLDAVCEHAFADVDRAAAPLHVLGFSQGAATACRWLQLGATAAERLVLWGGSVPPDVGIEDAASALRRARLTLVVGREDRYATPDVVAEQEARLRGHGVPFELVTFDGGHVIDAATLRRVMGAL
jgi:predicted esterase